MCLVFLLFCLIAGLLKLGKRVCHICKNHAETIRNADHTLSGTSLLSSCLRWGLACWCSSPRMMVKSLKVGALTMPQSALQAAAVEWLNILSSSFIFCCYIEGTIQVPASNNGLRKFLLSHHSYRTINLVGTIGSQMSFSCLVARRRLNVLLKFFQAQDFMSYQIGA